MPLATPQDFDSRSIRILVIDDNSPFVLPLLRSFSGYKNIHLDLLLSSSNRALHFRYSRFLGNIHQVEKLNEENLETIISDAVRRFDSDLLIPTREWISVLLYEHKDELGKFVKLHPLPDSAIIKVTGDKWNLNQWLKAKGFPYALCSENLNDWSGSFPVLIKPVFGIGGKGIRKVDKREDLLKLLNEENNYGKDFILQEFVEGFDIDVSFFALDGKIIYHTIQRGLISESMVYSKGIEFVKNEDLLKLVSSMIRKLNYTGIAHLDFRYSTSREEYILIDFNSRYWSSVQGSRAMGINFPYLVIEYTLTHKAKLLDYRTGHYYFSTTALKTMLRNLFSGSKYPVRLKDTQLSYIYQDPLPELMFLIIGLGKTLRRKSKQ